MNVTKKARGKKDQTVLQDSLKHVARDSEDVCMQLGNAKTSVILLRISPNVRRIGRVDTVRAG